MYLFKRKIMLKNLIYYYWFKPNPNLTGLSLSQWALRNTSIQSSTELTN